MNSTANLPKVRQSRLYQMSVAFIRPVLPYFGWVFLLVGATWSIWGLFQLGEIKLIVGLGVTWSVLGVYMIRVGYGTDAQDSANATDLKVITLCGTFSFVFLFLLLYGSGVVEIFR